MFESIIPYIMISQLFNDPWTKIMLYKQKTKKSNPCSSNYAFYINLYTNNIKI